jgi:hypothetical protein
MWLLGEKGVGTIVIHPEDEEHRDEIRRLFPEAAISRPKGSTRWEILQ